MCGFAGLVDWSERKTREELCAVINTLADTVCHRGPDDAGEWIDEQAGIALGFRRLAILDLSASGHQPMLSRDGRFALVFNGEIYNHLEMRAEVASSRDTAWRGHSDTETLLACFDAWGVRKALERAVGMFALMLWDRRDRRVYLARDRFGEKPLYYGWTRQAFVAGSELKTLTTYPGFDNEIDRGALALYLQYSSVPAPYSIYKNIYKLEPGCLLSLSAEAATTPPESAPFAPVNDPGLTIDRYWSLADAAREAQAYPIDDERAAVDDLHSVLADAVRLQSIADVPLGAFLSGGIDSSLIVALMQAQSNRRVSTFTIGFEERGFNEADYARAVARHLGTDHTEQYVSAAEARELIPALPDLYSEPFADSSQIPTHLVSKVARRHVTVALSGDGGDEIFGGYNRYTWAPRVWNRVRWLPRPLRAGLSGGMQRVPSRWWDAAARVAPGPLKVARLGEKTYKLACRLRRAGDVDQFYKTLATIWPSDDPVVRGVALGPAPLDRIMAAYKMERAAERWMLWDTLTYLPDDILHKVDRASMGVGLETRAPFLDHRVAEFAWRLPMRMRIRDGNGKWILRHLLYRYVPPALVERPKMGFAVPIDSWLRGPLREWAEELLNESRLNEEGYFDPLPIRRKWAEHLSGTRDWQHELWAVLMFQAWWKAQPR
jgi:asparagine synthase (glutamine-hydrolysing)